VDSPAESRAGQGGTRPRFVLPLAVTGPVALPRSKAR
jgi:hypothetical protein